MSECARAPARAHASARQLDARATRRARVDAPSAREGEAALETRARGRGGRARAGWWEIWRESMHSFIHSFIH